MQVMVSGIHVDIGEPFQQHVEDVLLDIQGKFNVSIVDAKAQLSKDNIQFRCDLTLHLGKGIFLHSIGSHNQDGYYCFDNAVKKLELKLRRQKKRLQDHNRKRDLNGKEESSMVPYYVVNQEGEDQITPKSGLAPPVIAELQKEIPQITVSEAVMKLDLSEDPAMLFKNVANGKISMIYRRVDGNIGWVETNAGTL